MRGLLAPSCPPPPGQSAAATDAPPPASVAGFRTEEITIRLSPAVNLIRLMIEAAQPHLSRDEIAARAYGTYAMKVGVPALARDGEFDLVDIPDDFRRPERQRFRSGGP